MAIEHIKLSQQGKDSLVKLKRATGIMNWNVLCRWGFCVSLAEPNPPVNMKIPADSNVEMSWQVFGGEHAELLFALLKVRAKKDGIELTEANLAQQFRLHLHRGIAYLAAEKELNSIAALVRRVLVE